MFEIIREFPVNYRTDRDAETPVLLEFLDSIKGKFDSVLDVGACYSANTYAPAVREIALKYDGIDIKDDKETVAIVDEYFVGNAITTLLSRYDLVICVSTIEHAGISTYKSDPVKEAFYLFKRCLQLANKYLWISFPVGQHYIYPNELQIFDKKQFESFKVLVKPYKVKYRFFYTQWAQGGYSWKEHRDEDFALSVAYRDEIGNQSICVMEIEK